MIDSPVLVSVQVGQVKTHGEARAADPWDRQWTSAFYKDAVVGPIWLGTVNLAGDQQHYVHHGGPDKAVLAYAASHYPRWREEVGLDMPGGGFGENFTIDGLSEDSVCIGDTFEIGTAHVQVAQPRIPCDNIARRWHMPILPKRVEQTGRTGWYLRVMREGFVEAGQAVKLLERPHPDWTVKRAGAVRRRRQHEPEAAKELAACPALAESFRKHLI